MTYCSSRSPTFIPSYECSSAQASGSLSFRQLAPAAVHVAEENIRAFSPILPILLPLFFSLRPRLGRIGALSPRVSARQLLGHKLPV